MTDDAHGAGAQAARRLRGGFRTQSERIADPWGRRHPPQLEATQPLFGQPLSLRANDARVLAAFAACRDRYSLAPATGAPPLEVVALVSASDPDPGPAPDDLERTWAGAGRWLWVQAGAWGGAYLDLDRGAARLVVHPRLAERGDLLGGLLDTVLLNLAIGAGFGMLHASCLARGSAAVLVLGDHNAGKSTTSLRLLRAGGFLLLTDSMVFVDADAGGRPRLHGFPVGRIKLRGDVAAALCGQVPAAAACLAPERVRDETKHVLDLTRFAPERIRWEAFVPDAVHLCLLRRGSAATTTLSPATGEQVAAAVVDNSLYYDAPEAWEANAARLGVLLAVCACHHLEAGTDAGAMCRALIALVDGAP